MKKIIAFGGSSSKTSINKQLATYAANLFENASVEVLDLNDYEMPVFSVDKEKENGIHPLATEFYAKIGSADLIVLSLAEHNGAYSTAFKNILDWTSRINAKTFQEKEMLLLATSPGARGGSSVLDIATKRFPYQGAIVKGSFSLPSFYENFDVVNGIINPEYKNQLLDIIKSI
ncbi:NADPH-dependent FMN reductase [Flavobacterium urocaniciphilum]|uniref:NAD(P)H-dependent FMN reductase n=1 Tax=Flavobacterium urocaniciphilum TaxID=1299341 RepID=A0A1H9AIS6_9FLAO|nr:NAD(P)H-dependent oxidoreductase [Flavobacterium urocaniciphilum]SEP76682.1 NAD(P)H-dependent FMN reductase [Flavobacterium urocaniciphilum]